MNRQKTVIMDPLDIFPMKVWEETLDRFQNPIEKLKLIKLNRSFELLELFQEKGNDWHFSAVLGVLLKHRYLQNSAILNCSMVSKGANGIVNNFVDDFWKRFYKAPEFATPSPVNCMEHVETCLSHAEQLCNSNRSSLFICGGLLDLHCGEGNNHTGSAFPSLDNAARLISHRNIGINLKGIKVSINLDQDTLIDSCNFVRNLVESVPNVVALSISFSPVGFELEGTVLDEPEVVTLAELPNLKHLDFYDYVRNGASLLLHNYFEISQYFAQLACLEITISSWKEHYNGQVTFPNLQGLLFTDVWIFNHQRRTILDIVENLNAPSLKSLFLETMYFNLFRLHREDLAFASFLQDEVLPAISGRRPGQSWGLGRRNMSLPGNPQYASSQYLFKLSS